MRVFYSWQSDLPNATNRGFIQKALGNAAKSIRDDDSIKVEPVIDRDTSGVPGSPDIASTILQKIDRADAFVADISIINLGEKRPTPNPNILIELGYAMRTLGFNRIILIMNTAFGQPEMLPFDLKMRRVIPYNMPEGKDDRAGERQRLEGVLEEAIRTISAGLDTPMPGDIIEPKTEGAFDPVAQLERELNFKDERRIFLNTENGVAQARQEFEKVCSILEERVRATNEQSTRIKISFTQDDKNRWSLFCYGLSLVVSWSRPVYANELERAELYLGIWRSSNGFGEQPREIRKTIYVPDIDKQEGIGWFEKGSSRKFFLSNQLSEIWFQRLLDEVAKL